ncbi:hypothetical protein JTE90_024530 [Oedothorax gibbosus]|uniref:Uncharacterized protein n=1 Tax=Oedothorax gibbosus TaxID=931172 RepID=A0AAV6VDV0_9ARAC|nr:hypothetical protein JTE90_024530 [Oedothorax gibbosus]
MTILLQYGFQKRRENTQHRLLLAKKTSDPRQPEKALRIYTEVLIFIIQTSRYTTDYQFACRIKCLHLLWNFIPEPLVTRSELKN